ncbi:MAG: Xylose isomerase protein barrel [Anaerospora sp.]|nr:Xylose isomerase protein barrel [Anaerospora sp.]
MPREWFHFAHLCDGPAEIPDTKEALIHTGRDERLYAGEGGIDIAAILKRLPAIPYSIELPHLARVKELGYAEHAWRCLQSAKNYLAVHQQKSEYQVASGVFNSLLPSGHSPVAL